MEALYQQLRQVAQSEHVGRFWVLKGVDLSLFRSLTGHYDTDCTKKQSPAMYTRETPTQSQRYIEMPLGNLPVFMTLAKTLVLEPATSKTALASSSSARWA